MLYRGVRNKRREYSMKNRYYGLVRSPMRFEYTINHKSIYVYNSLNFIYGYFLRNEFLYYATINIFEKTYTTSHLSNIGVI